MVENCAHWISGLQSTFKNRVWPSSEMFAQPLIMRWRALKLTMDKEISSGKRLERSAFKFVKTLWFLKDAENWF